MSDRPPESPEKQFAIGVDPGVTTGLALVSLAITSTSDYDYRVEAMTEIDSREFGEWDGTQMVAAWIATVHSGPAAIVIEDFVLRQQNMDRTLLAPVRITSLLGPMLTHTKAVQQWHPDPRPGQPFSLTSLVINNTHVDISIQQPAQAKTTFSDDRLKHYNIYDQTKGNRHARDAVRHAATYLHGLRG